MYFKTFEISRFYSQNANPKFFLMQEGFAVADVCVEETVKGFYGHLYALVVSQLRVGVYMKEIWHS